MDVPVVVVEVAPTPADGELAGLLVRACTSAVPKGGCALAGGSDDEDAPFAVAIVSWHDADRVSIEVGVRGRGRGQWLSQRLSFQTTDDPRERWRAVGLAIGTLVGEMRAAELEAVSRKAATPAEKGAARSRGGPAGAAPRRARTTSESGVWLDASALTGPALDDDAWRVGGSLRSAYQPRNFFAFATLAASYAVRPEDTRGVSVAWTTFGLGAGHQIGKAGSPFAFDVRADVLWQDVRVSAVDPESGSSGSAGGSLFGLRAGADASFAFAPPVGVLLGAELTGVSSAIDVRVRDTPVGTAGRLQYAIIAGARIRLR